MNKNLDYPGSYLHRPFPPKVFLSYMVYVSCPIHVNPQSFFGTLIFFLVLIFVKMFVLRTTDSISTISVFFVNSCWYEDCDYCRKNINNRRWLVMYFFLNDCHLYTSFSHIESIWLYIHVFTSCHSIGVKFIRLLLVTPNRRVIAKPKQVLTFTCRWFQ